MVPFASVQLWTFRFICLVWPLGIAQMSFHTLGEMDAGAEDDSADDLVRRARRPSSCPKQESEIGVPISLTACCQVVAALACLLVLSVVESNTTVCFLCVRGGAGA